MGHLGNKGVHIPSTTRLMLTTQATLKWAVQESLLDIPLPNMINGFLCTLPGNGMAYCLEYVVGPQRPQHSASATNPIRPLLEELQDTAWPLI